MKILPGFKVEHILPVAAFFAGLSFGAPALAEEFRSYLIDLNSKTVNELSTPSGDHTAASRINDTGQVVGWFETGGGAQQAFITGPDGVGMRDVGTLGGDTSWPKGINNTGQVVGQSSLMVEYPYTYHAFITGPNGMGMRDLGTLGEDTSGATDINDAGQVVGDSYNGLTYHAFITGPNGVGMRGLGTLSGTDSSIATGINNAGQVAGWSFSAGDVFGHAFITGPNGVGIRELDTFGIATEAWGLNDAGQVFGRAYTGTAFHAFITGPNGMGMRDLGAGSYANGINDAGQVVGTSGIATSLYRHAFITGPNGAGMMDLNSLVDLPHGVILTTALDINNRGQVIAIGIVPEPEISALLLAGLALVESVARRKKTARESSSLG